MVLIGFFAAGTATVLILLGLRGKRIDDHPVCGKCRFDLAGVFPVITTCPECGCALANKLNSSEKLTGRVEIRIGNRRRGTRLLALGVVGFILSLGILTASTMGVDWDRYKPYPVLKAELDYLVGPGDAARTDAILTEILRRVTAGDLDAARLDSLVNRALRRQAETDIPWTTLWGDVVDAYDVAVGLDEDRLASYLRRGAIEFVEIRPSIRSGDLLPVRFSHGVVRLGAGRTVWISRRVAGGTIAGRPLPIKSGSSRSSLSGSSSVSGSAGTAIVFGDPPIEPGLHQLTIEFAYRVTDGWGAESEELTAWTTTIRRTLDVLPADETDIAMIDPAASGEPGGIMRGDITVDRLAVRSYGQGPLNFSGTIYLKGVYVPCAFDVLFYDAAGIAGSLGAAGDGTGGGYGGDGVVAGFISYVPPDDDVANADHGFGFAMAVPDDFVATTVDVVLRPSRKAARGSLEVTEIWGGEIVIKGVPITWPAGFVPWAITPVPKK